MKKGFVNLTLAVLAILLLFVVNAMAQAPETMVYQGRLADADGNPLSTAVDVNFALYGAADADPADSIWSETLAVTPDDQGVFTVELGTLNPLHSGIFSGEPRFLGIIVGDDPQMTPKQLLASAPYAISATPTRTFPDTVHFANRIIIGNTPTSTMRDLVHIQNGFNTTSYNYGLYSYVSNETSGSLYGVIGMTSHNGTGPSNANSGYGLYGSATTDGAYRYGAYCTAYARNASITTGATYGVYATAYDGATAYGIYAYGGSATTNYAGYFNGNINVTGTVVKGATLSKIDHPTDPTNKYLYHSVIESPDMMNVYNGNVTTDASGIASVTLPDYFKDLNKDFRYQLTVIGEFAQAIIGEEISDNQFTIKTDKPSVKVSWQVTGIRKDAYAEANRMQVVVEKPINEKGLYLHPEARNLGPEMQIHYEQNLKAQEKYGGSHD